MAIKGKREMGDSLTWEGSASSSKKGGKRSAVMRKIHYRGVFVPPNPADPVAVVAFTFEVPDGASDEMVADKMAKDWPVAVTTVQATHPPRSTSVDFKWGQSGATRAVGIHTFSSTYKPKGGHARPKPPATQPADRLRVFEKLYVDCSA